jgi:UDP-N-acetylglucosamine 2-epimerase (hydrolysing)
MTDPTPTAPTPRKQLLFVTGTRADYGKLEPLALAALNAGHGVTFFVTGMHMSQRYGLTKLEVHAQARFEVVEFTNQREGDPQDIILAKTVIGFSDFLQEDRPDLVIIHGDRIEALACSLVCATNYVRCAHVEGGEVSGTIDELFRHCNTKLASVHLVSSDEAAARVSRLGEPSDAIHVIGSPELDIHGQPSGVTIDEVRTRYDIDGRDYGICVFHPVTSEGDTIAAQAEALFGALEDSGRYFVVILPNNDPGSDAILRVISRLPAERFRVLPSMRFAFFSELMRNASAIVGNSSMGVREAPFLGVPSLDIGTRQANRNEAESLSHARADDREEILRFLRERWGKRYPRSQSFGSGNAARRFVDLLESHTFWNRPLQKYFVE